MLLLNSTFDEVDFHSLVGDGRVLCVNISHIQNDLYHLEYLYPFLEKGLDKILAISSRFDIHHPTINSYFPNIITLSDPNFLWIDSVRKRNSFQTTNRALSKKLKCQQVWCEGKQTHFFYQPYENQLEDFIKLEKYKSFKRFGTKGVNWLKKQTKVELEQFFDWETEFQTNCDVLNSDYSFIDYLNLLQWYKLVPNKDLEKLF